MHALASFGLHLALTRARPQTIWEKLSLVRIYTKPRGVKVPDYTAPVVLKRSHCTIEECVLSRV